MDVMPRPIIIMACGVLLAAGGAWGGVGARLPGGTSVGTGVIEEDPQEEIRKRKEAFRREYSAARKLLNEKKWGHAREKANKARYLVSDQPQADQLQRLYQELENEAGRRFAEGRKLYDEGEYVKAVEEFEMIARLFGAVPSAARARDVLKRAKTDPAIQAALPEVKAAAMDKVLEADTQRMLDEPPKPVTRETAEGLIPKPSPGGQPVVKSPTGDTPG